jgi:hypothetical protein
MWGIARGRTSLVLALLCALAHACGSSDDGGPASPDTGTPPPDSGSNGAVERGDTGAATDSAIDGGVDGLPDAAVEIVGDGSSSGWLVDPHVVVGADAGTICRSSLCAHDEETDLATLGGSIYSVRQAS